MGRGALIASALLAILALGHFAAADIPGIAEQQARLNRANAASDAARARSRALEQAAERERDSAAKARTKEAAVAERIVASEADIAGATARIAIIERQLVEQRTRVAEQQGPILRLVAALQSMARRPQVLAIAQPGSTADMVHVRAVLGTTMPVVEKRTADIRAELNKVRQLRDDAGNAVASLRRARDQIDVERVALVKLEGEHRARASKLTRGAMVESDRSTALGEQAREIIAQMEDLGEAAAVREELAALPGPLPRPDGGAVLAKSASNVPPYRLPVDGTLIIGMGELSPTGVRARGLTFETGSAAPVVAPASGKIAYAGEFRGYGGVVIIDHGSGWTSLVAGLGAVRVKLGSVVTQGALIGAAPGGDSPRVTIELRRRNQPMDLAQLLD